MLTLDEARGIAAQIWLRPNFRRTPLDPIMCDHVANLLVDEITKATDLSPELDKLKLDFAQAKMALASAIATVVDFEKVRDQLASLKDHYQSLNDQYERLKVEHAGLEKHQKDLEHVNGNLRHEVNQSKVTIANLQSELDALKLGLPKIENKDEAV